MAVAKAAKTAHRKIDQQIESEDLIAAVSGAKRYLQRCDNAADAIVDPKSLIQSLVDAIEPRLTSSEELAIDQAVSLVR